MANSNEEEKKETKQIKPNPNNAPNTQLKDETNPSCHKRHSFVSSAAFILAIAAIVITLYNNQTNKNIQKHLSDENRTLMTQVEELGQNQTNAQEKINEKADKMQQLQQIQSNLQSKIDNLNKVLETAMSQRLYQNQDWLLLKARYYLELAQINTHWSVNYTTTISLLQQADKLLNQSNAPQIFDIRQAIAKEIAQLRAVPTLDIAGLLSQLDAAQASVNNLTLQANIEENNAINQTENTQTSNSSWRTRFKDSMQLLQKLVIVRRTDENIQPLMSPLYESILRESIKLNLQEAQWAILNNDPDVYQLALKQASTNIKKVFNEKAQSTTALLNQLKELQELKLTQEKPETGLALPLLNQLIENKEAENNQINNSKKGETSP